MRIKGEEKQSICSEDTIICNTLEGMITSRNPGTKQRFGYSAQKVIDRKIGIIVPPEGLAEEDAILERLSHDEPITDFETARTTRNGRLLDVSHSVSPLGDSNGRLNGGSRILRDITERKQFLPMISHEIRTPLNTILEMADLLWESELDAASRKSVEVFRRASANLLTLVDDLIDLTTIESGHFELEQIDFDLRELVERTIEIMSSKTQAKRLHLRPCVAPDSPPVLTGDPTRLKQILLILLENVVKSAADGEITLRVKSDAADESRLHFEVTNNEPGLPGGKIAANFADVVQAENAAAQRFGGSGLALRICCRLVERMGGQLAVRTEFGKGSTFYFDALFADVKQDRRRSRRPVINLVGQRVLVVDASPANRLVTSNMCRAWAMTTSECATASAAIAVLRMAVREGKPFNFVIVDPLVPDMDDSELVSKIRLASKELRIVVTTSDRVPSSQAKIQQFGISGYVLKPVRSSDLLGSLRRACDTTVDREESRPGHAPRRILIAEDSEDNRFLMKVYLKKAPYEIAFAENGQRAVEMAGSQSFDLILMDIQMPVMDGLAATKRIREREQETGKHRIWILALSANAGPHDREAARAAGCDAHLAKPISRATLLQAIDAQFQAESAEY